MHIERFKRAYVILLQLIQLLALVLVRCLSASHAMELFQDVSNQPPPKQQQPVVKTFERRRRVVSICHTLGFTKS